MNNSFLLICRTVTSNTKVVVTKLLFCSYNQLMNQILFLLNR